MTTTEISQQAFGHYDVEQLLGRGAIGTVYLARDRRIGRHVALKTVQLSSGQIEDTTSTKEFYSRLQREAEVCGALHHPNIVTLYEVGYDGDRISYLAMEYVEGDTLLARMKSLRPDRLPVDTSLRITADVLRGLAYAHGKGIIHRDIKPANVLIAADGTAKIGDFGIARPQNSTMTGAGALLGTPNYMSPEQVLGQTPTPRTDVFSTGVVLFEMLTGEKPFAAQELTVILHNILRQPAPHVSDVNPAVPRSIGDFVARLLEKSVDERPDAAQALEQLEAGFGIRDSGLGAPSESRIPNPKSRAIAVLVAALAIVVAGIVIGNARVKSQGKPTVTIPAQQIREFDQKRKALEQADALLSEGKYEESLRRYEDYLAKYPQSVAAQEGRDRARQELEKAKQRKPARKSRAKDEDISPSELLNRLKRVFKR